jgi:hypothetical protein
MCAEFSADMVALKSPVVSVKRHKHIREADALEPDAASAIAEQPSLVVIEASERRSQPRCRKRPNSTSSASETGEARTRERALDSGRCLRSSRQEVEHEPRYEVDPDGAGRGLCLVDGTERLAPTPRAGGDFQGSAVGTKCGGASSVSVIKAVDGRLEVGAGFEDAALEMATDDLGERAGGGRPKKTDALK